MRNKENLHMHELMGLRVRIVRANDGGMVGMQGTVVNETRETLVIEEGKERTVPKRGTAFEFTLDDGTSTVLEGDSIAYRPEDRIKRAGGSNRRAGDRT